MPILCLFFWTNVNAQRSNTIDWFGEYNLQFSEFNRPGLNYAPFTRWWWPGNDVTQDELVREINLFADNNIGGVEIQAFALVMPAKGKGTGDRIMSYDTPAYYENLIRVMQEAVKRGMTVDMTDGSGWPAGGPHLLEEDNNLTLEYGMIELRPGNQTVYPIPRADSGDRPSAKLVALLAAKVLQDTSATNQTFILDPKSVVDISAQMKDTIFSYSVHENGWKAIAFWSVPTMEKPMLIAKRDAGFVMNHFDSAKVFKNYNYFFGERTGLQPYFGKPFRAIFDDSYEFKADRHFSDDFISTFEKKRGYDITPYLPANMWYGYNNMYYRMEHPRQKPEFSFGKEDWRLRYDYDLTLSDVIGAQFLKAAGDWTQERGLMHRSQPYGLHIDNMATVGLIDIPEVETMQFNKGSEGAYKLISSGAHLYNRPLISCESAVYINRGYMTTPQKLKLTLDKIFSCGVNHVVWHGTAYRYFPGGYPEEGWYPFMNAYVPINFSSDLNESNPFWKYMKDINGYAQRAQYVLRSGKPHADVLIYYPFLSYSEHSANPNEILLNGCIEEVEPSLESENVTSSYHPAINSDWLDKIWPLINELNARGITWDWVNDASLQEMNITGDKLISIRGNEYQSLILFDLPYIQVESAKRVKDAAIEGANILAFGKLPDKQPSFYNYEKNDELTSKAIKDALQEPSVHHIGELKGLAKWETSLSLPISNRQEYGFIRQIRRKMDDGTLVQFIWNTSSEWQKVHLSLHESYRYAAWLNAEDGSVQRTAVNGNMVEYLLPPLSTVFLYVSEKSIKMKSPVVFSEFNPFNVSELMTIDNWNLTCDSVTIENTALFNWRENDQMKYKMTEGVYSSGFELDNIDEEAEYYMDFGKVYFSADLEINGEIVGSRIFAPFNFNITDYLKTGKNDITLKVTPTLLNGFIGRGDSGVREYKNYKNKELMSQGLIGPVKIFKQKK
jgi:hypothetical protein